jgi:glycosyltransferase involved in cell wall biosynthesis
MSERISVVIPTHDSSEFIGKALESVFDQTLKPSEIIVVDDASADHTCDLVTTIAKKAPVKIVLERLAINSGGPARPLNIGIGLASSSLIATLDHDDLMLRDKLRLQKETFDKEAGFGLILSNYYYQKNNEMKEGSPLNHLPSIGDRTFPDRFYRIRGIDCYEALIQNPMAMSCSNFLFPKNVWSSCGGFDEELTSCCDYAFLQSVARNHDIGIVNEPLFYYNWRDESLYRTASRLNRHRDFLHVFQLFEPRLLSSAAQQQLKKRLVNELLAVAHLLREEEGAYLESAAKYFECLSLTGWQRDAIIGIAKLIPHKVLGVVKAPQGTKPEVEVKNIPRQTHA